MQGLICEGTTEDSVRLSDDLELVGELAPRQGRVQSHHAGVSRTAEIERLIASLTAAVRSWPPATARV